jgi:hypothetical protein
MLCALLLVLAAAADCGPAKWCPEGAGYRPGDISHLDGSGSDDVWAWGLGKTLHHWDGTRWTPSEPSDEIKDLRPLGRGSALLLSGASLLRFENGVWSRWLTLPRKMTALWAASLDDVWLFGPGALHVRAGRIEEVPFGQGTLLAAAGRSPTDVWAVGNDAGGMVVAHWDGQKLIRELLPWPAMFASVHVAPDGTVTLAGDSAVLRRTAGKWSHILEHSWIQLGRGNPLYGVGGKFAPIALMPGLERLPALPNAEPSALWAKDTTELWVGGTGFLARWHEGQWTGAERVSTAELFSVSGNAEGEVYAVGQRDVLRRRDAKWTKLPTPGQYDVYAIYSAGPTETWAVGTALLAHFDGHAWGKNLATREDSFSSIWGSGPKDIWIAGKEIFHWNGKLWKKVKVEGAWDYPVVVGDGKGTVWVLARGPRPEEGDRPSTGKPDEVLEIKAARLDETGKQTAETMRWLSPGVRPESIAWANGSLWSLGRSGLQRYDGTQWILDPSMAGTHVRRLVSTKAGLMLIGYDSAWRAKGTGWERLPAWEGAMAFDAWANPNEVFLVGRSGLILEWRDP